MDTPLDHVRNQMWDELEKLRRYHPRPCRDFFGMDRPLEDVCSNCYWIQDEHQD